MSTVNNHLIKNNSWEEDGYSFASIAETDFDKVKFTSSRKKYSETTDPVNRFYAVTIKPEIILENTPNTSQAIDSRSQEILMVNLPNVDSNPESYASLNQDWTLMNVREWVETYDRKQLRSSLTNVYDSGVVEPGDRRELVRIAVAGMIEYNDGNLYPSCQLKTQLAKDIVTAFPKLRSASGGYEHFYDPKTNRGFIEFRLKTLRLKLNPSEKKRAISSHVRERKANKLPLKIVINEELLTDAEFNAKVSELFMKQSTEENKMDIIRLTEETRANRHKQIKTAIEHYSLGELLNIYPKFKDFQGEVIRRDFLSQYPHNDTFVDRFAAYYTPRILQYCSSIKPHLVQTIQDISDDNLKALILLPELLPSPNYIKRKENRTEPKSPFKVKPAKTMPNELLLQFVNVTDESVLHKIYAHRNSPFLLCYMVNNERRGSFHIMADGHTISVGDDALRAFDVLVKLHYCFFLPFASELVYFYDFLTGCVMQLNEPKGCCVALHSTLSNVTLCNFDANPFMFPQ